MLASLTKTMTLQKTNKTPLLISEMFNLVDMDAKSIP